MRAPLPAAALRVFLSAGLIAQATACTHWRVEPGSASEIIQSRHPDEIRVQRHDGGRLVLRRPWVDGDSLASAGRKDTTRVALADVNAIAVRRSAPVETVGLTVLVVVATLGLACAMACDYGPIEFEH